MIYKGTNSLSFTIYHSIRKMLLKSILIFVNSVAFMHTFLISDTKRDCMVSDWSPWIEFGVKEVVRDRKILGYPSNGGAACPSNLEERHSVGEYNAFLFIIE